MLEGKGPTTKAALIALPLRGFRPALTVRPPHVREVARQIDRGTFEHAVLDRPKLSTALREMSPQAGRHHFKDTCWSCWPCRTAASLESRER